MAQVQGYDKKEIVKRKQTYILGVSVVYMMQIISGFSADTAAVSKGKSYILAKLCESIIQKLTAPFFSYDRVAFTRELVNFIRKCAHALEFFLLASLFMAFVRAVTGKTKQKFAALMSILFAFFDEFHQAFVPGRGPSLFDVAIDSFGVIIAVVALHRFYKRNTYNII